MAYACSLHVGINNVDPAHYNGWDGQLFCCENDALFYNQLAGKIGITDRKMLLSSNTTDTERPTSANLNKYLSDYSGKLKSGDFLLITYSGHGGQLQDQNFDEDDGADETWCLYDRQFLDDELWNHFNNFEKGVRILMISDSCHSETMSKYISSAKDIEVEGLINDIFKKMQLVTRNAPKDISFAAFQQHKDEYYEATRLPVVVKEDIGATVLLLGACRDNEKASEWDGFGLFTSTIRKVLSMHKSVGSYDDLHEKIQKQIPAIQTPTIFVYGSTASTFRKEQIFKTGLPGNNVDFFEPDTKKPAQKAGESLIVDFGTNTTAPIEKSAYKPAMILKRDGPASPVFLTKQVTDSANPWDDAYKKYFELKKSHPDVFVEPDVKTLYQERKPLTKSATVNEYMGAWPKPAGTLGVDEFIWHLDNDHSQLHLAAQKVKEKLGITDDLANVADNMIRIGHIDTGYIPSHPATPKFILTELGISFVNGEEDNRGTDVLNNKIKLLEQDGHGSATLAILAGNYVNEKDSYTGYKGFFGGIPFAKIVPIRICDTVYNAFNANDVARGIEHAVDMGCEVITMSMAGYPTRRVAKAVNYAYEKGVVVVTAAGNNWIKGISKHSPKAVMYPARFDRVIAACGVCYNEKPYDFDANREEMRLRSEGGDTMQGNWGPEKAMKTALAAYTPNLAWANNNPDYKYHFSRTGGGTSSATPQIAAAAALWIMFNRDELSAKKYKGTWKQAEAVRQALFRSGGIDYPGYKKYYGNGSLKAGDALSMSAEIFALDLKAADEASVSFLGIGKFISQWFRDMKTKSTNADTPEKDSSLQEMMSVELTQLLYKDPSLYEYLDTLDLEGADDDYFDRSSTREKFKTLIKASPHASDTLKAFL